MQWQSVCWLVVYFACVLVIWSDLNACGEMVRMVRMVEMRGRRQQVLWQLSSCLLLSFYSTRTHIQIIWRNKTVWRLTSPRKSSNICALVSVTYTVTWRARRDVIQLLGTRWGFGPWHRMRSFGRVSFTSQCLSSNISSQPSHVTRINPGSEGDVFKKMAT